MEGIGYREFFDAAESGELTLSDIAAEIIRDSKRYAKRQMTFLSSFPGFRTFHPDDADGVMELLRERGIGQ